MKKFMLLGVVFCGVLTLVGAELPISGWKIHTGQGKFSYELKKYPLLIKCTEATADKSGKGGVWGRVYRQEKLEVGKKYLVKVTCKIVSGNGATVAVWVRGGASFNMFSRTVGTEKILSREFTPTKEDMQLYINLMDAPGEVEVTSVAIDPVE